MGTRGVESVILTILMFKTLLSPTYWIQYLDVEITLKIEQKPLDSHGF